MHIETAGMGEDKDYCRLKREQRHCDSHSSGAGRQGDRQPKAADSPEGFLPPHAVQEPSGAWAADAAQPWEHGALSRLMDPSLESRQKKTKINYLEQQMQSHALRQTHPDFKGCVKQIDGGRQLGKVRNTQTRA